MTKQELWKLIDKYRNPKDREAHWRNIHALDIALLGVELRI